MPIFWQKMKKSLVQLALNPFLHGTSETRVSGTRTRHQKYPKRFLHVTNAAAEVLEQKKLYANSCKSLDICGIFKNLWKHLEIYNYFLQNLVWFCGLFFLQNSSSLGTKYRTKSLRYLYNFLKCCVASSEVARLPYGIFRSPIIKNNKMAPKIRRWISECATRYKE